jgi:hypothetical protein
MDKYIVYMHDSMPGQLNDKNKEFHILESKSFTDENTAIDYAKSQGDDSWIKVEVKDIESNKIIYET